MKNFIVMGTQRTGSSALAGAINLHSEIACGLEWTLRSPISKKIAVAERALSGDLKVLQSIHKQQIESSLLKKPKWLGFRRLFSSSNKWVFHPKLSIALWVDRFQRHIDWLKKRDDIHIIHIVRKNNLEWIKSVFLAKKSNLFVGKEYPSDLKISINLKNAVARVLSKNWVDSQLNKLSKSNPYHLIYYEDFLNSNQLEVEKVLRFLYCENLNLDLSQMRHKKQSKGSTKDYIINFSMVENRLIKHKIISSYF